MKIYLLDCTLRDGGYVNNWEFGQDCIKVFPCRLAEAGADIIELGFIRDEAANPERSVYTSAEDLKRLSSGFRDESVIYSAMIEGSEKDRTFPARKLGTPDETGIELIRICLWKRLMKEHIDYCKAVSELGYKISVQPTAIDQYNNEEFIQLLKLADEISPFSFYLVDTWGTQDAEQITRYAELADKYLSPSVKIGYHGHNNKMQALSCMDAVLAMGLDRDICADASVMGMGRGPGNLQTEVAMDCLNRKFGRNYRTDIVLELCSEYISRFYEKSPWGYSPYHFISSDKKLSQDFATYFKEQNLAIKDFLKFIQSLSESEKIVFRRSFAEKRCRELNIAIK